MLRVPGKMNIKTAAREPNILITSLISGISIAEIKY